ncbi:hypothetical protein THASP1DRAFT_27664, partial [Thamnocephalis sphaerospora]
DDEQSQGVEAFPELRVGNAPSVQSNARKGGRQRSISSVADLGAGNARRHAAGLFAREQAGVGGNRARGSSFSVSSRATPVAVPHSPPPSPYVTASPSSSSPSYSRGFQLFSGLRRGHMASASTASTVSVSLSVGQHTLSSITHGSDGTTISEDSVITPDNLSVLEEHIPELHESSGVLDVDKMLDELDTVETPNRPYMLRV